MCLLLESLQEQERGGATSKFFTLTASLMVLCRSRRSTGSVPSIVTHECYRHLWLLWSRVLQPTGMGSSSGASESRPQIQRVQPVEEILQSRSFPPTPETQSPRYKWKVDDDPGECLYEGRATTRKASQFSFRLHIRPTGSPSFDDSYFRITGFS